MNTVNTIPSAKGFLKSADFVKDVAEKTLTYLNYKNGTVELYLVTSAEMREINKTFRGKDEPTNILSFEAGSFLRGDIKNSKDYLGEIYISPQIVSKRKESLSLLVIHGILHLVGYTHSRVRDRIDMEKKEDIILAYVKHYHRT